MGEGLRGTWMGKCCCHPRISSVLLESRGRVPLRQGEKDTWRGLLSGALHFLRGRDRRQRNVEGRSFLSERGGGGVRW